MTPLTVSTAAWSLAGRWAESSLKVHSCTATKVSLLLCSWGFATSSTAGSAEHERFTLWALGIRGTDSAEAARGGAGEEVTEEEEGRRAEVERRRVLQRLSTRATSSLRLKGFVT
mmetsp:Transcript_41290/g.97042  ORF Transcript_41290/g.97042 Transcript_41290/m.97042 type:complete len:115 (-) Transcript_41290:450-794(-)